MLGPLRALTLAAVVLVASAILAPAPASADHLCEVQDTVISCDDPGIVQPHAGACDVLHYHGTLNGVTDDGQGCGHGEVTIVEHGPPLFTDMSGALQYLGFSEPQVNELAKIGQPVDPQRYRYATSFTDPPTLDAGWTHVVSHGVAEVEFGPDSLAGSGGFQCNTLDNGFRTFCMDGGPQPGVAYTGFFTTYGDRLPIENADGLSVNLSWPTTIGDQPTWQYQGEFVADTWQGASYIPYITYGPNPWALQVSRLQGDFLIDEPDSHSFGLIGGDSSLLFVPTSELMQGNLTWDGFRSGFALHVHDGSFGNCETCQSTITPVPAFPRDGLTPFVENEVFIANGPAAAATAEPTSGGSTGSTEGTATTDGTATAGTTTDGGSSESDEGGGDLLTVVLIFVVVAGVGTIVVGVIVRGRTRTRTPAETGSGLGPPQKGPTAGLGGTRTREGDPTGSTPPPEPETPSCSCTVSVAIEGQNDFGVCCMQPKLSLHQTEYTGEDAEERRADPSKIHLDANVDGHDGWDLFDVFYQATITASCDGGGEARIADATYNWSITEVPGGFDISVSVSVPVHCPNGIEHPPATAQTTYSARYHSAPCKITVLVERVAWNEISHVDVQIVCGEYNEIFGYFPKGARSFAGTIAGTEGQVLRTSASRAHANRGLTVDITDEIGSDYSNSHGTKKLNVYFIEPDDCSVCDKLRNEWELLAANPGTYWLTENNCAYQGYKTLRTAGAIPADEDGPSFTPSGLADFLQSEVGDPTEIR